MSTVDDRRRLVGDKLPCTMLARPDREIAIVNAHDRAGHRDLGRHPSGHERGAIDNQDAVCRMGDLKVGKVAGSRPYADSSACRRNRLLSGCR
jgi:hypothetical protein